MMHDEIPRDVASAISGQLQSFEPAARRLARDIMGELIYEEHNRPCRSILAEGEDGIFRKLEVAPVIRDAAMGWCLENYGFELVRHAWKDAEDHRKWKSELVKSLPNPPIDDESIYAELLIAWSDLQKITEGELRLVRFRKDL